jgi:sialic acid synthase SpsE
MATVANRAGPAVIDRHIASKQETGTPVVTFAITPSDVLDLQQDIRALYIGVSGNVAVVDKFGNSRTYVGLAAGTWQPIHARRVLSTGTTATNLVGGV